MKTLAKLLYVEADEEITDLVDRLRDLSLEDEVTFVVPDRARALQSAMSFRLLKRYADSYGKRVNLVSTDPRLQAMALEAGFTAYPSLAAYDSGTEVHQPELVGEPPPASSATAAAAPATAALAAAAPAAAPMGSQATGGPRGVATLDRPREASVVSAAPKKKPPPPSRPASSGPPLESYRPYLIAAGVLVVLGLLAGILYLPTATATVLVSGTPIKQDITLLGAPGTLSSADHFATQAIHAEDSQTLPGTPTGQKQIAAVAAAGTVTISLSCFFICEETVPKGWIVMTADGGKRYATQRALTLTGPSSGDVAVTAVTAGAGGNTDAGTITRIDGNPANLSAKNKDATTGGVDARTATIILQSDIDSIRDVYAKDGVPKVTDQLNSKAQGLKLVLVGSGVQATATSDHKAGEEVPGMTVTIKVAGDGVVFDDKIVKQMLKTSLVRKIPQGSQLTNNVTTTYDAIDATADGHITLNGHASGFTTPVFLETAIRSHLKGLSPSSAHAFLQSLPNVVDARVTQSPYGLPWLPLFSSRITLKIQEVSNNSASP
ncbi:MAG TPA: baseplate J/gp47 family protein [Candidatus Dormibacteraeota bacterium]|nr:baseplate J/gp47 family protein [Candidatus Dormibacteraeota bacterium]